MTPLQHDPKTRSQIKDALWDMMYGPVKAYYKTLLDGWIARNTTLQNLAHASFIYRSVIYKNDIRTLPKKQNRLDESLHQEMDSYLAEVKKFNDTEVPSVLGLIDQVLNTGNSLPDYLRLLPEAVHSPLNHLISTCPCKTLKLTDQEVTQFQEKNKSPLTLMKQRMITNMII